MAAGGTATPGCVFAVGGTAGCAGGVAIVCGTAAATGAGAGAGVVGAV